MEKEKQKDKGQNKEVIDELLKEKDKQIAEYEKRIEKMKFDNMLDAELTKSKAKNKTAVRALLDMEKIGMAEGELVGFNEQLKAIKAKEGYLFESGNTGGGVNPSGVLQQVDLENLSDDEYFRVKFKK